MNKTIVCIATADTQARTIIDRLRASGLAGSQVSVLYPDRTGNQDGMPQKEPELTKGAISEKEMDGKIGQTVGWIALGGSVGWMLMGSLAISGIGLFIAAGPILTVLGAAATGSAVGGIAGALIGIGMPDFEATSYEDRIKAGDILISVHTDSDQELDTAKRIFHDADAHDVSVIGEGAETV